MKRLIKRSLSAVLTLCLIMGMLTCAVSANAASDYDALLQGLEKQYFTDIYPGATSNLYLKNNVDGVFGPWVVSGYDDNTFVQENGRTVVTTPSTNLLMTSVDNFYLDGGFYFEMGSSSNYTDADYVEYLKIGDLKFQIKGTGAGCRYELYNGDSLIAYADYNTLSLRGYLTRYLTYSNGYLTVRADADTHTTSWTLADGTSGGTSIDISNVNLSGKIELFKNDQGAAGTQYPFWGFRMKGSFPYKTLDDLNNYFGSVVLTDEAEVARAEYIRNWAVSADESIESHLVEIGSTEPISRLDNWDGYIDVTLSPYHTDKLIFSTEDIYVGDRLIKGYDGNWNDDNCTQIAFTSNGASYTGCITYLNFYTPSGNRTGFSVWQWSGAIDYTLTEAGTYTMTAKFERIKDAEGKDVDGSMDGIQFGTFEVKELPRFFSGNVFAGNVDVTLDPYNSPTLVISTTDLYVGDKLVKGYDGSWNDDNTDDIAFTVDSVNYTGNITWLKITAPSGNTSSYGVWSWENAIDYVLSAPGEYKLSAKLENVINESGESVAAFDDVYLYSITVKDLPRITYNPDGVVSYAGPQNVALVPNTTLEFSTTDLVVGDKLVKGYGGNWTDIKTVEFKVNNVPYKGALTWLYITSPSGTNWTYGVWSWSNAIDLVLPEAGTYTMAAKFEYVTDSSNASASNFDRVDIGTFKVKACPHNYEFTENVPAECTTDGYDLYTCSYCGGTEHRNVVTKLGSHSYNENGVCTVCENVAEAKVGDTYYDTLQGAHDSVSANSTIIMNSNVNVYFKVTKDIILDLNGYTLTSANSGNDVITLESGNITVYDNSEAKTGKVLSNYNNSNNQYEPTLIWSKGNSKKAVIYGGTWTANADIHPNGGKMFGANLEIYGGTFAYDKASSNHTGLFNSSGYNVKLYGGNFNDNSVTPQEGYEYVEQEDGTWNVESSTHVHNYTSEITIEPTCGTDGEMTYTCSECGDSYTEVMPATGEHDYVDGECTVCHGADKRVIENESSGKKYEDFATAISEATAGDTLKLIGNYANYITITKDITLDLNGYEMTNPNGGDVVTMDGGNVVIKDSVGTGKVTSVYTATNYDPVCIYSKDRNNVATIYGGTFSAIEGVDSYDDTIIAANVIIYGGTFIHPSSMAKGVFSKSFSTIRVYGGTYSVDPTEFVADNYETVDNGDGTYTVIKSVPTTVTFVNRNGSTISTVETTVGASIALPALPTLYGYTCNGWLVNGELKAAGAEITVTEGMTIKADFTVAEKLYTVTVNGTEETVSGTYTYNTKLTLVFDKALLGETGHFGGWAIKKGDETVVISYAETYIFYVGADATIEALVVEEETEIKPVAAITDTCDISANGDGTKWSFLMERSVPKNYTYVTSGFAYGTTTFTGIDDAQRTKASQSTNRNGQFRLTLNFNSSTTEVYVMAYLTYADAEGNQYTVYSNNGTPVRVERAQ